MRKRFIRPRKVRFRSSFIPSPAALKILREGRIISEGESPRAMIERVVDELVNIEDQFGTSYGEKRKLSEEIGALLDQKYCVLSTPILTNAGRYVERPLSACTVPPIDFSKDSAEKIREVITRMHQEGMGTGFNLDELDDPVATLRRLNYFAVEGARSGKEDRPVGNMAILSVYHPEIFEFIEAKVLADKKGEVWKFNISVNCDSAFFEQVEVGGNIILWNGARVPARKLLQRIAAAANRCADPGLIFLERMEDDNPTPGVGHYITTAPCAEVGLAKGESCQFGYLNLARFLGETNEIDIEKLKSAVHVLTRILDNALEVSIKNYSEAANKQVMFRKRKIGIGICGLADLFIRRKIHYDSAEACRLAVDLVTLINFESKLASCGLARRRGSFAAMHLPLKNRYFDNPSFLQRKYGGLETKYVPADSWSKLAAFIKKTKFLRNASTIALPPTGRSALLIDASTGIEPIFSKRHYLRVNPDLPKEFYRFIRTAKKITPGKHLDMAIAIQVGVDESISKTINLSRTATKKDVERIYLSAWRKGLKGISIYRENSKRMQPKHLS